MLLAPPTLDAAMSLGLIGDDFHYPANRLLFSSFVKLRELGSPIDVVTISALLTESDSLERAGGMSYLAGLSASTPSVTNAATYVARVQQKAVQRRAYIALTEAREQLVGGERGGVDPLDAVQSCLTGLRSGRGPELRRVSGLARKAYDLLRERAANPSSVTGLSTGFDNLDTLLSGLQPTDLVVLAARPSMGKTAFALNLVTHAVMTKRVPVAFFSLEMGELQLVQRILSSVASVSGDRLRKGRIRDNEWGPLLSAARDVEQSPLYVVDKMGISIDEASSMCRRIPDLGLVVVDYLQLMRGSTSREGTREQEIASISRGLKGLAKELNIPVLALAQLNRGVEHRADKRPMLADLRESGAIEQDADIIMFLYREEVYDPTPQNEGQAELLVRKHRNGSTGDVPLCWHKTFTRFEDFRYGSS